MKNLELPEENSIDSLITGYLSGNSSEDEKNRLELWVKESDDNKQYFRSFCDVWQLSAGLHNSANDYIIADKISAIFEKAIISEETKAGKSRFFTFIKYAAAVLILITAGYFAGKISSGDILQDDDRIAIVYAPMGSKAISVLPDGTQIWLNAGSRIEYNTHNYNISLREVSLTGEAYFKVKTNPEKPFVVKAKGINVKALGTEFNVKAYPEETQVVTTLVRGIVKIEGKDKNRKSFSLEMKPSQIVALSAPSSSESNAATTLKVSENIRESEKIQTLAKAIEKPVVVNNVNTSKYTSWKDNQWVLEGEDIADLVVMLERKFNVKIFVESPELNKYKFTGTFKNETLEQVLSVLKIATPMKYSIGKGTVALKIDPVLKARYQKLITEQ